MITAYIESIQGNTARILVGDEAMAISIPMQELPAGVKEGSILRLKFINQGMTHKGSGADSQR